MTQRPQRPMIRQDVAAVNALLFWILAVVLYVTTDHSPVMIGALVAAQVWEAAWLILREMGDR